MKTLVYGAGNIGCLYAARLRLAGEDVTLLARGERLEELRAHGILLVEALTGDRTRVRVKVVNRLRSEDEYDLVLVVLPKHRVAEVLPALAAHDSTPSVLFFGNNAAGPAELVLALGRDRVLQGFPGAAAIPHDGALRWVVTPPREQHTTIGELTGEPSERVVAIADMFERAGFPTEVSSDMDAWLATHAVEIVPTALAFYAAGSDMARLVRSADVLRCMLRAIREGHRVLRALDISLMPASHRVFTWLPMSVLLAVARRKLRGVEAAVKIGHALAARAEMQVLDDEIRELSRTAGEAMPALDLLRDAADSPVSPARGAGARVAAAATSGPP